MRNIIKLLAGLVAGTGLAAAGLVVGAGSATAASTGVWKIDCAYAYSLPDDPIVYPGKPGASHRHDFFGNLASNANSTYATMNGVTSTCAHNDRASYWAPTLYRNGVKIKPSQGRLYYTNSVSPGEEKTEAYPANFKMIVGNAMNTVASATNGHIQWGCGDDTQIANATSPPPAKCGSGDIQVRITFPSCWDGVTTAGNEIAHMAYPSRGKCPSAYSHPMPTLRFNINYPVGTTTGAITLSSGSVYSIHADFWNVWDQPTLETLVQTCIREKTTCPHFTGTSPGRNPPTTAVTTTATGAMAGMTGMDMIATAATTMAAAVVVKMGRLTRDM
jgi:Domain of unknown function (DUF1996)